MNKIRSVVTLFVVFLSTALTAFSANIDSIIQKTYLDKTSTISVSVKDVNTGKPVYEYNQYKLMNPASVQKIFTMRSVYRYLGADYSFKTRSYIDKSNNLYIRLSGDPSFSSDSLKELLDVTKSKLPAVVNDVVIDPTIFDNKQWGIGWMWDDDMSPLLPKYSPFSINENKIQVVLYPSKNNGLPIIKNNSFYDMKIVNLLKNGSIDNIILERMPWISSDMTYIKGTIKSELSLDLPVSSPENYFLSELRHLLAKTGITYSGSIKVAPISQDANKLAEFESVPLIEQISKTLKESNNFYSEMLFKAAGASYSKMQGTTEKAVEMLEKEFVRIPEDGHVFVDACGISRNNLMSADWVTSALNKIYKDGDFDEFSLLLPKPMEGTLSNRLLDISLSVRAKTGTASGISSIAGYIDAKSGKKYSFAIFIQNHNLDSNDVKKFEDRLIREFYKM